MTVAKLRTAVLVSGRGSNLRALIEAARQPDFPAEIGLVVSNVPDANGLEVAAAAGVPTLVVGHRGFASREDYDAALHAALIERGIAFCCLAGFMRILTPTFVARWEGRMLSIHPALLPAFKGLDTHARAIAAGVKIHGCTVHFVVPELDAGPIVAQAAVPVLPDDTPETLGARVLVQEHVIYPRALKLVASGLRPGARSPTGKPRSGSDPRAALVVPDES